LTAPDPGLPRWNAQRELRTIEALTRGGVRIGPDPEPDRAGTDLVVELMIDCSDRSPAAVELQDWEQVLVRIPPDYPLRPPRATIVHDRFARLPHVVWKSWICLYLAEDDWNPGHGMFGFVERLLTWFQQVAEGSASGPDVPWDPPITAASWHNGLLVVNLDVPEVLESDAKAWAAVAVVEDAGADRLLLRRWVPGHDLREAARSGDGLLVPVIGLPEPVAFSYPQQVGELLDGVTGQQGEAATHVLAHAVAKACDGQRGVDPERILPLVLLLSPAPRYVEGGCRTAHIAAWWVDTVRLTGADRLAPLSWMTVFDHRPQTTVRRDSSRAVEWLNGRRILVLGCGGVGAPVAEFCARAGAARVEVVDVGTVHPGILVRQPYVLDDIGRPKVEALVERLDRIAEDTAVHAHDEDAVELLMRRPELLDVDLVVDATASTRVAAGLELIRRSGAKPPVLTLIVGHCCDRAVGTLALPAATGGGADVLRHLLVQAITDESLTDVFDDIVPDPSQVQIFQPEPGCSDPTYVGSAADLASLAGQLLNHALLVLRADLHPAAPASWAFIARSAGEGEELATAQRLQWPADAILPGGHGYEVRVAMDAAAAIRREVARIAERGASDAETGGVLLGEIDHVSQVVWVSAAHGPPPGSEQRLGSLTLPLKAAAEQIEDQLVASRRLLGLVGVWHTHPHGPDELSEDDLEAMDDILAQRNTPTLLLIVSATARGADDETGAQPGWWAQLHFPAPATDVTT
jgi:proteasome lid subunit RPN8/RPN11